MPTMDFKYHTVWVPGDPQPFPKKEVAPSIIRYPLNDPSKWKAIGRPIDRDYRTRKNPLTGKIEKFDRGFKRAWMNHVADVVHVFMEKNHWGPFPAGHPVAMGCLFFMPKADGNKTLLPAQVPDEDNLLYAIRNALKSTRPRGRGSDGLGPYPEGVLYFDDDQVVAQVGPCGKRWATDEYPPGVLISFADFYSCHATWGKYDPIPDYTKQENLNL